MAEYVVIPVIRGLNELLLHEPNHLPELRGRIEVIQMKLRQLQAILEIADARQEVDKGIQNWIAETREVAYDIEDLLLVAVSLKKEGGLLRRFTRVFKDGTGLQHLDQKFQVIEAKISALETDLRVRNINPGPRGVANQVSQRLLQQRRTYSHQVEEDFVGMDEDVKVLVEKLVKEDGDRNHQVVSITGMGGIGKTTIAMKIFHHADVRSHFHAFAWVCVSQQWQQEDVLQRILNKLAPEKEIHKMKVEELVEELFEVQKGKRCLIVLDNVRERDVWNLLSPAFLNRLMNSKLLLTTRNREIARHIDTCYLYEQRHLNEEESWELLKKKVYRRLKIAGEHDPWLGSEDDDAVSSTESFRSCQSDVEEDELASRFDSSSSEDCIQDPRNQRDMERLGREIVAQCRGLPLAIIVLGGLLVTKSTISEWRTVHQNFNSPFHSGSTSRESGRVHEVLALSYHDLPYQLKPCFLHLGNFPEDYKIPTRKLYQLWAAEGFLSPEPYHAEEEESTVQIAEHYLGELVQRCMVQVQVDEGTGRLKSCRLNDLTREFCLLKGKEENFLKKVPVQYEPEQMGSPYASAMATPISVTRRLCVDVDNHFSNFPPRRENFEHVRSAMFFSRLKDRKDLQSTLDLLCRESKVLRVLDLEGFDFGAKLSKSIENLTHLRYLSLRGSQFYRLPPSIDSLKYLQTLDLRVPFFVCLTVPNVIWRLNNLKHLYLPRSHRCDSKLQLSGLSKLEILKNFDSRISVYRDITKLPKLQKMAATLDLAMENLTALFNCLREHNHIRDTSFLIHYDFKSEKELNVLSELVAFTHLRKLDLHGVITKLPAHIHFAQRLTKLTLRKSRLKEDPMATLENLPSLCSLILRTNVFEGNAICCSPKGFPQLRILVLQGLPCLEYWRIEEEAMPTLHSLMIDECNKLRMLPEGIKFLATLRELVIANMPDEFNCRVLRMQEGGEGSYIDHIPSVRVITDTSDSHKRLENQLSDVTVTSHLRRNLNVPAAVGAFIPCMKIFWTSSKHYTIGSTKGMGGFMIICGWSCSSKQTDYASAVLLVK